MAATSLCDDVTSQVVGIPVLRARFAPDAPDARQMTRALFSTPFLEGREAFEALRRGWLALEAWWDELDDPARRDVRTACSGLPETHRLRALLAQGAGASVASEQELFALKRWLLGARTVLGHTTSGVFVGRGERVQLVESLLSTLHPDDPHAAHFHLSDALDPELAEARSRTRRRRAEVRGLEDAAVAALAEDYPGLRLRLDGAMTMPATLPRSAREAASEDPRLAQRSGAWHLTDDGVRAAREALDASVVAEDARARAVCARVTEGVRAKWQDVERLMDDVTRFDVDLAKVRLKQDMDGCWPQRSEARSIELERGAGVHLPGDAQRVSVAVDRPMVVITGPNMGGKSSLLALVGACQWCLQHGMPAPARSYRAPWVGQIVYVGSDGDARTPGLSSFGREVRRVVDAAQTPGPRLWLFDELGRGTHPEEGASLAMKITRALVARGDRVLAATHFPEVARLEEAQKLRVRGLDEGAEGAVGDVRGAESAEELTRALRAVMDYQPVEVTAHDPPRDAERIARWLGLGALIDPVDPSGD